MSVLKDLHQLHDSFNHLRILFQITKKQPLGKCGFPLEDQPQEVRVVLFLNKFLSETKLAPPFFHSFYVEIGALKQPVKIYPSPTSRESRPKSKSKQLGLFVSSPGGRWTVYREGGGENHRCYLGNQWSQQERLSPEAGGTRFPLQGQIQKGLEPLPPPHRWLPAWCAALWTGEAPTPDGAGNTLAESRSLPASLSALTCFVV